jgi:hypothetical protein
MNTSGDCDMSLSTDQIDLNLKKSPIFTTISGFLLLICLMTPLILLTLPVMLTIGTGVTAFFRKEKFAWVAVASIIFSVLLMFAGSLQISNLSGDSADDLGSASLTDWSWDVDPSFGTEGTVKWRAEVKNLSDRAIENAKIDFSTYDKSGRLLASTSTYVQAIPAGEVRTSESYADLYGNEENATAVITEVHFSSD